MPEASALEQILRRPLDRRGFAGLGAATHVTGAFAFAAVGKGIEMMLKR